MYTFAIQWPAPFAVGWHTSEQRFDTVQEAANALSEFLITSLDNGQTIEAKLVKIKA